MLQQNPQEVYLSLVSILMMIPLQGNLRFVTLNTYYEYVFIIIIRYYCYHHYNYHHHLIANMFYTVSNKRTMHDLSTIIMILTFKNSFLSYGI